MKSQSSTNLSQISESEKQPSSESNEEECDHEWEFQDDSFDHEFGTERVHYWQCSECGATKPVEASDFDDDTGDYDA